MGRVGRWMGCDRQPHKYPGQAIRRFAPLQLVVNKCVDIIRFSMLTRYAENTSSARCPRCKRLVFTRFGVCSVGFLHATTTTVTNVTLMP